MPVQTEVKKLKVSKVPVRNDGSAVTLAFPKEILEYVTPQNGHLNFVIIDGTIQIMGETPYVSIPALAVSPKKFVKQ